MAAGLRTEIQGVGVPTLIYGTAWKEDETARLTRMALAAGVRGIDTANQRRHYHEAGVGEALAEAFAKGLSRQDVFLQTKFTHVGGQDRRLPYDPGAPVSDQLRQSFASSLEHLGVEYLDSYLLHGPSLRIGLADADREAWRAMEALHREGKVRLIGISNVSAGQLELLLAQATVKPAIVQNRCYASQGWDRAVRDVCAKNGVLYQGFSLLTANREVLAHPRVRDIADRAGRSLAQVVFRFALQIGMVVLTGTTSAEHLAQDLQAFEFELSPDQVRSIEMLVG